MMQLIKSTVKKIYFRIPLVQKPIDFIRSKKMHLSIREGKMVGSQEYTEHLKEEISHYEGIYSEGRLLQDVPSVWDEVEKYFSDAIKRNTGVKSFYHYVAKCAKGKKNITIYSIGSGACGVEVVGIAPLLKKTKVKFKFICTDINKKILQQGQQAAKKKGINMEIRVVDANKLKLEANKYDIVIAYAALHHLIELDKVAQEINKSLKKGGYFVTVDIPTRNGYKMWDDSYRILKSIWDVLPPKFKISHTAFDKPTYMKAFPNIDYSKSSFECINSEAVIPSLRKHMEEVEYVPSMAFTRRFF